MRWVQLIHAIFAWNIHMIKNTWNPIWAKKHPELSGFLSGMSIVMANVPWLGLVISCLGKTKLQGIPFRFCWTFFFDKSWVVYGSEQTEPPFVRTCELGGAIPGLLRSRAMGSYCSRDKMEPIWFDCWRCSPIFKDIIFFKGVVEKPSTRIWFDIFPFVWGSLERCGHLSCYNMNLTIGDLPTFLSHWGPKARGRKIFGDLKKPPANHW